MSTKIVIEEIYRGCTRVSLQIERDQMNKIAKRLEQSDKFMWIEDFSDPDPEIGYVCVSATHKNSAWLACVSELEGVCYVAAQGEFTFGNDDDLDHTKIATEPSSDDIVEIAAVIRDLLALAR